MDAADQLLLSEGVCCQLGIVSYHPSLLSTEEHSVNPEKEGVAVVPTVRAWLLQSIKVLPCQFAIIQVQMERPPRAKPMLLEQVSDTEE